MASSSVARVAPAGTVSDVGGAPDSTFPVCDTDSDSATPDACAQSSRATTTAGAPSTTAPPPESVTVGGGACVTVTR